MDLLNEVKKLAGLPLREAGPDGLDNVSVNLVNGEYGFSQVIAAIETVAENLMRAGIPAHHTESLISDALHFVDGHLDNIVGDLDPKHPGGTQSFVPRR